MYPLLCVSNLAAARDFYVRHFGFEVAFDADWYVSLKRGPHELAFIRPDHGSIPEGWRKPAAGVLLTVEVENAAAEHRRLVGEAGLPEHWPLQDEEWGQRHFMTADPNGVLIDVVEWLRAPGA
jgi:catechol 2,3-dioxygenase-like lactoylglutathione lyase family enzyme